VIPGSFREISHLWKHLTSASLDWVAMARGDFYASPFGVIYSAYMERPRLGRLIARAIWGGDPKRYYDSMGAVIEVPAGETIVDCPCGAGPVLPVLDPEAPISYVAVDLSPSMLRRARKKALARSLGQIQFIEADATDIPLSTDSASLFLSFWGLHCFEDPAAAVTEAARVLKPGGRLVGAAFVRGRDSLRQRWLVRPHRGDFGPIGTETEVRHWLEVAGFSSPILHRSGPMLFFDARSQPSQGRATP
jgi:SAM-dependent methyltransferase